MNSSHQNTCNSSNQGPAVFRSKVNHFFKNDKMGSVTRISYGKIKTFTGVKGVSPPISEYYHGNWACLGFPCVVTALVSMDEGDRYPWGKRVEFAQYEATFVSILSYLFGFSLYNFSRNVERKAKNYVTVEYLKKLILSNNPDALRDAQRYIGLAAKLYNAYRKLPDKTDYAQKLWLSFEDLDNFRHGLRVKYGRCESEDFEEEVDWDGLEEIRKSLMSLDERNKYKILLDAAKEDAFRFAEEFALTKKTLIFTEEDFLCEAKLMEDWDNALPFLKSERSFTGLRPFWARKYIDALTNAYGRDQLAWAKTVFRIYEPIIRKKTFDAAKVTSERPFVVKSYRNWMSDGVGYTGIGKTSHNVLYRAMKLQDDKVVTALRKLKLLNVSNLRSERQLHDFYNRSASLYGKLQTLFRKKFPSK